MNLELSPQTLQQISGLMASGVYSSPDEIISAALSSLEHQRTEVEAEKARIREAIEIGYQQAMNGQTITAEELRIHMKARREAFIKAQKNGAA